MPNPANQPEFPRQALDRSDINYVAIRLLPTLGHVTQSIPRFTPYTSIKIIADQNSHAIRLWPLCIISAAISAPHKPPTTYVRISSSLANNVA